MPSDLLNNGVIEVAGVTQKVPCNIIGMLETLKDIGRNGKLRSLSKLGSFVRVVEVDVLHPAVMIRGSSLGNVFLEDDDIGIGHLN
jgi:hypothetical protein